MNWYKKAKNEEQTAENLYQKYLSATTVRDIEVLIIRLFNNQVHNINIKPIFQKDKYNLLIEFDLGIPSGFRSVFPKSLKSFIQQQKQKITKEVFDMIQTYPIIKIFEANPLNALWQFPLLGEEYTGFKISYDQSRSNIDLAQKYNINTKAMTNLLHRINLMNKPNPKIPPTPHIPRRKRIPLSEYKNIEKLFLSYPRGPYTLRIQELAKKYDVARGEVERVLERCKSEMEFKKIEKDNSMSVKEKKRRIENQKYWLERIFGEKYMKEREEYIKNNGQMI